MSDQVKFFAIRKLWLQYSKYYRETLPDEVLSMYAEQLMDLEIEKISAAFRVMLNDQTLTRLPFPNRVRSIANRDCDTQGQLIANRILAAVRAHGWPNPERAKEKVGEYTWGVVLGLGGWEAVCHRFNENESTTLAQIRDFANSYREQKRRDEAEQKTSGPALTYDELRKQIEKHKTPTGE